MYRDICSICKTCFKFYKSKFKSLKGVGVNTFEKLFQSRIKPILEYCRPIRAFCTAPELENIQNMRC